MLCNEKRNSNKIPKKGDPCCLRATRRTKQIDDNSSTDTAQCQPRCFPRKLTRSPQSEKLAGRKKKSLLHSLNASAVTAATFNKQTRQGELGWAEVFRLGAPAKQCSKEKSILQNRAMIVFHLLNAFGRLEVWVRGHQGEVGNIVKFDVSVDPKSARHHKTQQVFRSQSFPKQPNW